MTLNDLKRVHCLGLGGVGVSAVAILLRRRGLVISGSDLRPSLFTAAAAQVGVTVSPAESAANITPDIDLVIYSDACPPNHVERLTAQAKSIPQKNFSEVLGWLMATSQTGVAVAGVNGKSTTTALLGLMLAAGQQDPMVVVGAQVPEFNSNVRLGQGKVFVTEADDYRDHFLHLHPTTTVITNIELDHVDYFPDLAAITKSFEQLVRQTAAAGHLIINLDDPVSAEKFSRDPRAVTYSQTGAADMQATAVRVADGRQEIDVTWYGQPLGTWLLHVPGSFNVMNVLAAAAAAMPLGVAPESIASVVANFTGIWRRFEILNPGAAITIVSDYAHHPTSIRGTLEGAKTFYPGRRILAVFQPHHHNRLTNLFEDFAASFSAADELILSEVYAVAGRENIDAAGKTSQDLFDAASHPAKHYAGSLAETEALIRQLAKPGDVVILMGAGDIWEIGPPVAADYA